jgi:malate dehydrogenase (oxaloacetate-decarboxylating)
MKSDTIRRRTNELKRDYIIPAPLDRRVSAAVAQAVKEAAIKSKVARI